MYYDKQLKKINLLEWSELRDNKKYRIIAETTLPNGKWITTVWVGIRLNIAEGKPIIFETMVFPKHGVWDEIDMDIYSTLEKAKQGHKKMVNKYNKIYEATKTNKL